MVVNSAWHNLIKIKKKLCKYVKKKMKYKLIDAK